MLQNGSWMSRPIHRKKSFIIRPQTPLLRSCLKKKMFQRFQLEYPKPSNNIYHWKIYPRKLSKNALTACWELFRTVQLWTLQNRRWLSPTKEDVHTFASRITDQLYQPDPKTCRYKNWMDFWFLNQNVIHNEATESMWQKNMVKHNFMQLSRSKLLPQKWQRGCVGYFLCALSPSDFAITMSLSKQLFWQWRQVRDDARCAESGITGVA